MARQFTAQPATRERVPLLVGLMGPSGSGKTYSALRLATGIQEVSGGDIYLIDTENKRGLHYADKFKYKHVPFEPPFGSLDYLEALKFCVAQGAGVVIVDSMSHEHEGPGGMIDAHARALDRMAGDDYGKRERMTMIAWQKPKADRRALINGLLQLNCNFIFCFRAKQTTKPVKNDRGKTEMVPQGFGPIAGEEFLFEQTLNALLLPGCQGVPTWRSEKPGERAMIKLPEQFKALADSDRALSEAVGKSLAKWAAGGVTTPPQDKPAPAPEPEPAPAAGDIEAASDLLMNAPSLDALVQHWRDLGRNKGAFTPDEWDALTELKNDRKAELSAALDEAA